MDPSQDEARLQQEILQRKLTFETKQDRRSLVFLDRGIPDSLSYYRRAGLDPSTALTHCFTNKYRYVFLFERLKFEESLHRIEKDEASSQVIQDSLENDYLTAGYRCIRVPVFSNDKEESISLRLEFIEKTLIDDQGLNFKGFNI